MRTDALHFDLPDALIATTPAQPRDSARLMVVHRSTGQVEHAHVRDLAGLGWLKPGDLMIANQTRVLPAAFHATRTKTDGRVAGLFLHAHETRWALWLESRGKPQPGESITLDSRASLELQERVGSGQWIAQLHSPDDTWTVLERVGQTPLPPYIRKQRKRQGLAQINDDDALRYNTVFAQESGSVAAPTAGLHFTQTLLDQLEGQGIQRQAVTLHVGAGTFAPVRTPTLEEHDMHEEWISVGKPCVDAIASTRAAGKRVWVVGTTTVRALESLPDPAEPYTGSTRLFITPDTNFAFRFTDGLMTNFHLPGSTLLAMVAALPGVGVARLLGWYRLAIDQGYRFYSYGDAMLIV